MNTDSNNKYERAFIKSIYFKICPNMVFIKTLLHLLFKLGINLKNKIT